MSFSQLILEERFERGELEGFLFLVQSLKMPQFMK